MAEQKSNKAKFFINSLNKFNSLVTIILLIAVLVVVNIIAGKLPWKYDMTIDKIFSLSDQTKKVIQGLKGEVHLIAFFQEGNEDATVKALLEEYVKAGDGKIKLEYADAEKDPMIAKRYDEKNEGVFNNSIVCESGGKIKKLTSSDIYSVNNAYGKTFSGEQQLTGALLKVTSEKLNKIYFLEGHEETNLDGELFKLKGMIESDANVVESLNLLKVDSVPGDADAIVVVSPKRDLSTQEALKLKDYLTKSGRAMFMFDVLSIDSKIPNFSEIVKSFGIGLKNNFVVEENRERYYSNNKMILIPDYTSHPIVEHLKSENLAAILPFSLNLQILDIRDRSLSIEHILQTSEKSWIRYNLSDAAPSKTDNDIEGPAIVATAVTKDNINDRLPETRLVVTGNAKFIEDNMLEVQGNTDLFMNSLNWIENKQESITIRPKMMNSNQMMVKGVTSIVLMVISVILIPLLAFGSGFVVWLKRRHS